MQFQSSRVLSLASRLLAILPSLQTVETAQRYIDEALVCGIRTERDIAEFAALLSPVDRAGRPSAIDDLVRDPLTDGALKLFQIHYALHGERR